MRAFQVGRLRLARNRRGGAVGVGALVGLLCLVGLLRAGGSGGGGGAGLEAGQGGQAAHLSLLGRRGAAAAGPTTPATPPLLSASASLDADLAQIAALRHLLEAQRMAAMQGVADPWGGAGLGAAAAAALEGAGSPGARRHLAAVRAATTAAVGAAIHAAQHPPDCAAARLLVGSINKSCGFGCEMHHAAHLLALALASNRTLVLSFQHWRYDDGGAGAPGEATAPGAGMPGGGGGGAAAAAADTAAPVPAAVPVAAAAAAAAAGGGAWETAFLPISPCPVPPGWEGAPELDSGQPAAHAGARVVRGGIIDAGAAPADPQGAMPPDVFDLVARFNARPEVWWVGALAAYLMRPAPGAAARRAAFAAAHGLAPSWEAPAGGRRRYVAIHVRRTDKVEGEGAEAAAHGVAEYLRAADAVASVWEEGEGAGGGRGRRPPPPASTRALAATRSVQPSGAAPGLPPPTPPSPRGRLLVYLATDDARVLSQAAAAYPGVDFAADDAAASSAALKARHSRASLAGIADDVERLAGGAWLVGTFSSQVSRLAYELAQVRGFPGAPGVDPSFRASSVDSGWYYGGGSDVPFRADAPLQPATWKGANPRGPGDARVAGGVAAGGRLACSPLAGHPGGPGVLSCRRSATPDNAWENDVDAPAVLVRRCAVEEGVFPRLLRAEQAERAARGEV